MEGKRGGGREGVEIAIEASKVPTERVKHKMIEVMNE